MLRPLLIALLLSPSFTIAEQPTIIYPPALKPGDTIAIIAPAGPVERKLELAVQRLRELGYQVKVSEDIYRKSGFLAGDDERRADELMGAFRDPSIDAIFPARGGYGTMRILDRLDFDVIRENPKIFTGFSDITALHLAIFRRTGLITFHSPNPTWGLGDEEGMKPLTRHWYWRALLKERYNVDGQVGYTITTTWPGDESPAGKVPRNGSNPKAYKNSCGLPVPMAISGGQAQGRLVGGNLSLVSALSGSEFEIETDGRILFLEDIGEAPYRVDRMLRTLELAGKLDKLAGVVLGTFTRRADEDTSGEVRTIKDVLTEYFGDRNIPVIYNWPAGHHACNITLPHGAMYGMDADRMELRLLENPVR